MRTWYRATGSKDGRPVLFIHGNASNSAIWNPILEELPNDVYGLAPDLRMYGLSDPIAKINPERGIADWADDLESFVSMIFEGLEPNLHVVGHSLGGLIALRLLANQRLNISKLTLYAPPPPHGYITRGPDQSFVNALIQKNRDVVKMVVNMTFWHPSFEHPDIDQIVDAVLQMQTGTGGYPDAVTEAVSPIRNRGMMQELLGLQKKPPIKWVYGKNDILVANNGFGSPDERMIDDTRSFLEKYAELGGLYEEISYDRCGHSPFLEQQAERTRFMSTL